MMQKMGIMKERHSTLAVRLLVSFSHLSLDFKALAVVVDGSSIMVHNERWFLMTQLLLLLLLL